MQKKIFICSLSNIIMISTLIIAGNVILFGQALNGGIDKTRKLMKSSNTATVVYEDNMNGDNSISGLNSRGWIVNDIDGGGDHPTWFQGNLYSVNFSAYEGDVNDYVASDWEGANTTTTVLDHWLISPLITVSENDTISFWAQSFEASFPDSVSVYLSPEGGSTIADFSLAYDDGSLTQRYHIPTDIWSNWRGIIPFAGNVRFAIRYHTLDSDTYSFYLGIDYVQVLSSSTASGSAPTVVTTTATNISTANATLNGTVNPNNLATTYLFEYGTTTSYGNTVSDGQQINGNVDFVVSYPLTNLTPNTTYNYRLVATNSIGTSFGNNITFTTNSSSGGIDLQWKSISLSTFDWKVGSTVSADLKVINSGTSTANSHSSQLFLSDDISIDNTDIPLGAPISYGSIPSGDSITMSINFTVPSVNAALYYVGAIVDINNEITETNESNNSNYRLGKIIVGYPSNIQITKTVNFGDPTQNSSYKMIGLPGDVNIPISNIMTGSSGEDWIAYYDNGNTNDYLVAYSSSSTFNFTPGKAFWLLSNNSVAINQSASPVELQSVFVSTGTYEIVYPIVLHTGWNMITSPFEKNIDWSAIQSFNDVTEDLHKFSGNFTTSSILEPYTGFYFFNATNLAQLYVPYFVMNNIPTKALKSKTDFTEFEIELRNNDKYYGSVFIGSNEESKIGYDSMDRFKPPSDFEDKNISITNENLETDYKYLEKDFRQSIQNQVYNLKIKYPLDEYFNLTFVDPKLGIGITAVIIDSENNNYFLNNEGSTLIRAVRNENVFKLIIGDDSFINAELSKTLPKQYKLGQNYPNPFNPSTTITYQVPISSNGSNTMSVKLVVYDILGRELLTLVNEYKNPGNYQVEFDASDLSSGIYFYSISIVDPGSSSGKAFVETKKMVLLR